MFSAWFKIQVSPLFCSRTSAFTKKKRATTWAFRRRLHLWPMSMLTMPSARLTGRMLRFLEWQYFSSKRELACCFTKSLTIFRVYFRTQKNLLSLFLPVDHVTGDNKRENPTVCTGNIPADRIGLDIGPQTITQFSQELRHAGMVLWNGPVGLFEVEAYSKGSQALAQTLADRYPDLVTVIAGGDTVAAVTAAGVAARIRHLSTGGGSTLEFLEGKELPGLKALEETASISR